MLSDAEIHICRLPGGRAKSDRLYYCQGNLYHPLDLQGSQVGLVKRGTRDFMKTHKALVDSDRASPDYKDLVQLFDEQMATYGR